MSSAIQNRLVGTVILVALAVIFLPDILDGKKESNKDLFVDLPNPPKTRPVIEAKPFPEEQVKQATAREVEVLDESPNDVAVEESSTASSQTDAVAEENSPQNSSNDEDSLENATVVEQDKTKMLESTGWVVQLGVFKHQKNVRELLNKLESAGYRAFSQPVETSAGEFTKVFVGPDVQKDKLEKAIPHLNELTKLQGRLTPFTIK